MALRVAGDGMDEGVRAAIDGEMALLGSAVRSSRAQAERLLDEEFVEFGSSGRVWDRESVLAAMAGALPGEDEPIEPVGVRGVRLAENWVHVTYTTDRRGSRSRRSSLWRRSGGRWRLYFHQGTPVLDS
jgi:hypothetical protein